MLENLISFVTSFFIGLLIGIEREHSHQEGIHPIGVRTFILFSLLGTLAAILNDISLTMAITAFVFAIILMGYYRKTDSGRKKIDTGITTEISACMVFCIGYMILSEPLLAIILSSLVLLVLVERQRLHVLARKKFKPHAIETAIIFVIFSLGILPILPNHPIDPWGGFNPHNFGILIVTIAAIQFVGYICIRLFGERLGIAVSGFFGGFVSSTVVFAHLPHLLKAHPQFRFVIIASAILANLAMLIEVLLIIFVASPSLFLIVINPMMAMCIMSLVSVVFLLKFQRIKEHSELQTTTPFSWISLFKTAIFIAVILIAISITKHLMGTNGMLVVSFLGGLFEIHGISLATALLYLDHQLTAINATHILYAALLASFISKIFLLWTLSPKRIALETSIFLLCILASGGLTFWLVY